MQLQQSEAERVRQGSHTGTAPAILRTLARDQSATVRASLALNPATPPDIHALDWPMTTTFGSAPFLASKLAGLLPGLSQNEAVRRHRQVYDMLAHMVADTAVRVRAAIADAVKAMPEAPTTLVLQLVRDESLLSLSRSSAVRILTSDDLLALLAEPPFAATAQAVARRPDLTEAVSDAIGQAPIPRRSACWLANSSAQIRETTLDVLVARATMHLEWHEPLVHRPSLSAKAARALSEIVAAHLVEVLARRAEQLTSNS